MTNHSPSVLWYCWLGHQTCKNRRPYNLYCVGADVKPCSINMSPSDQACCSIQNRLQLATLFGAEAKPSRPSMRQKHEPLT